jgi:predicted RND superfamily exporter protein
MTDRIERFFRQLGDLQIRRPFVPIAIVFAMAVLGAFLASRLELRTRFDQLLPENQPSVVEVRRVRQHATFAQTALILLEGADEATLRRFADAIVVRMRALNVVSSAENGIRDSLEFLEPRAGLFLDERELDKLAADVDARFDWEIAQATGNALDDSAPPPLDLEKRFATKALEARFPDGWYERADRSAIVVIVRSPIPLGELDRVKGALDRMHGALDEARTSDSAFANVRATFTGDMVAGLVEYSAVRDDLLHVGAVGLGLVLAVVLLYFVRVRALVVMACTIACGLACTFGLTDLVIGHLNIATGFLFSIVAGNGINVGILFLSRYYEEKRNGAATSDAIHVAHRMTWPSTSVAAIAAAASYASLAATEFRTFRQFAFIGAGGMIVCWLVTVTLLPALLVVLDGAGQATIRSGVPYGQFFARIVPRAPRALLGFGGVVAIVGVICAGLYIARDPMEYDLTKIQNDTSQDAELVRAWRASTDILGKFNDAMIVLADSPAHADELRRVLRERWERAPDDAKPFEAVHSVFDFVPERQAEKLPVLLHVAERLRRAHERQAISETDWARLAPLLPPPDVKTFGVGDLPESLARPFTEKNGTRGTIVLVEPLLRENTNDLHYLLRYAESFRTTRLADGTVLRGSGRALVFADILDAVVTQVPRAIALSLVLTLLAVLFTFRHGAHSGSVLGALVVGFAGVAAFLFFAKVRLNFLNYIALPITFGIGVDYAVNVMQRYRADGAKDILGALRTTGGAVVLCSLTTMLGYFALIGSHNQAIRSLGVVAVVGEISCLFAAVLILPAYWYVRERTR